MLEKFFSKDQNIITESTITESEKNDWIIWKSALDKLKHDICIKIESPQKEGSVSDWQMTILRRDINDPSNLIMIENNWQDYIHDIGLAMRIYPDLEKAFCGDKIVSFTLSHDNAKQFLNETAWLLQQSGFSVIIPSWYTLKGYNAAKLKLRRKNQS